MSISSNLSLLYDSYLLKNFKHYMFFWQAWIQLKCTACLLFATFVHLIQTLRDNRMEFPIEQTLFIIQRPFLHHRNHTCLLMIEWVGERRLKQCKEKRERVVLWTSLQEDCKSFKALRLEGDLQTEHVYVLHRAGSSNRLSNPTAL